ncbi:MAG: alkaline phosphatase family protein [Candidatus Heimdallarchaeota archaeon]
MKRKNINLLLIWFSVFLIIQMTFGFIALGTQFDLNNKLNIKDDVEVVPLIGTPEAITDQILIFFVDGMRYDVMMTANTPNFDELRANGTTFSNYRSVQPSYSNVNYAAFSTGSTTNITNVFANANDQIDIPTLYSELDPLGLSMGLVTSSGTWSNFLGPYADVIHKVDFEYHQPGGDGLMRDAALTTIASNFSQIQFIDFSDVDAIGHESGATSDEYTETIELVDGYIGEIIDLYASLGQLENTTVVLFSDHGHNDVGGHGSRNEQETHATLVLSGKGIKNQGVIESKRTGMNSVTPTLLAMAGVPLAPTMNGPIIYDHINTTDQTNAIYAIQQAEIMNQQLNVSLNKIKLISSKSRGIYQNLINEIDTNITNSKTEYSLAQINESFTSSQDADKIARFVLRNLFYQLDASELLFRSLMTIGIYTLCMFTVFYLNQRKIIKIKTDEVFEKPNLLAILIGGLGSIAIAVITMVSFRSGFGATHFNSVGDTLPPILTAFILSSVAVFFLPWLIVYLTQRKNYPERASFKDWRKSFIQSSIGSVFVVSLPIVGYMMYYIITYGPWAEWKIPLLADVYAYMIIGIMGSLLYIPALILIGLLWNQKRKELLQQPVETAENTEK